MPLYIIVLWLEHIQNLHFFHQISIKFSYIFWCLILGLIFWVFGATWGQKGRFWEPLGAQLGPKWRPKSVKWRPKSAKWLQKCPSWRGGGAAFGTLFRNLFRRSISVACGNSSAPGPREDSLHAKICKKFDTRVNAGVFFYKFLP